jgi:non-heme Fe2+,alpha-ketoglutarate-dependent halogenase
MKGRQQMKKLSRDDRNRYDDQGYLAPIRVMSARDAEAYASRFRDYEVHTKGPLQPAYKHKLHLVAGWASDLVHHPVIVDAIEDLLGPDILCWTTNLLLKESGDEKFVSWHQDAPYWRLEPHEVATAWVALTPSTKESGCVRVLPGTHREPVARHEDHFDANNMLTRGQRLAEELDPSDGVPMELQPGEISLHHVGLSHGSQPNRSNQRRLGIAIRYMSAAVQKDGSPESATLVRGKDRYRHFELEERPQEDFNLAARLAHNRAVRKQIANNYEPVGDEPPEVRDALTKQRALLEAGLDHFYEQWKAEAE